MINNILAFREICVDYINLTFIVYLSSQKCVNLTRLVAIDLFGKKLC